MKRIFKWLAACVGGLIALVIVAGWIALSNEAVSRRVINFGLRHAPAGLTIGHVSGHLRGPLLFTAIRYRTSAMTVTIDSARVDWRLSHLLRRQLQLDQLHIDGLHIVMPDSAPPDTARNAAARPSLPVDVRFGDVVVRNTSVDAPGQVRVHFDSIRLTGRAADFGFAAGGAAVAPRVNRAGLHLVGRGNLDHVTFASSRADIARGTVTADGDVGWWPSVNWNLLLHGDRLQPATLMPDTTAWPGAISMRAATTGTLDSIGPVLSLTIDSIAGSIRRQPVSGRLQLQMARQVYDLDTVAVRWGSVQLDLAGKVSAALDLRYRVDASDLRTMSPNARGTVRAAGSVTGTRTAPHILSDATGARLAYGSNRINDATLHANADLARGGRINLKFVAESATISSQPVSRFSLTAIGTRDRHRILAVARTGRGNLTIGAVGGAPGASWNGRIDTLVIDSTRAGGWTLLHSARVTVSAPLVRIDTLCLAPRDSLSQRDSTGASACVAGVKRPTSWAANVSADRLPLAWFAAAAGDDSIVGSATARMAIASNGAGANGTLRVATVGAKLSYHVPGDKKPHALVVDSAAINGDIGSAGTRLTIGIRVTDERRAELAALVAKATLPGATGLNAAATRSRIDASIHGQAANLAFLQPFFTSFDSIGGAFQLDATIKGTVADPQVDGSAQLQRLVAALPGQRRVSGALELVASVAPRRGRRSDDRIALTPHDFRYTYRDINREHWLAFNGTGALLTTDAAGGHASLDLLMQSDAGARVASMTGKATLPEYAGARPLAQQQMTVTFTTEVDDLAVLQLLTAQVDSLHGRLKFSVDMRGTPSEPTVTAHAAVDSLGALLPFGSFVRGGFTGDMRFVTAADHTINGDIKLAPTALAFDYRENNISRRIALDSSALAARIGSDGVHGTLDVTFADSGRSLGEVHGSLELPQYHRADQALRTQPMLGTLTGKISDLSFIKAFTPLIDSAAGNLALDSKVTGTVADSRMTGAFEVHHTAVHLPRLGILVDSVELTARGDQDGAIVVNGAMRSGGGTMTIAGTSPLAPTSASPGKVHIEGKNFEAAHSAQLRAVVSPQIDVTVTDKVMQIRGQVDVPLAKLVLAEIPASAVAPSDDIVFVDSAGAGKTGPSIDTDVRIHLGDSVSFSGFNFKARLSGALRVSQQPEQLATATGGIVIDTGTYKAYGQDLTISQGKIDFVGGPIDNPGLNIRASRVADSVTAGLDIKGTLKAPLVTVFSDPSMSQTEALSYIVTGHGVGQGSGSSGSLISKALTTLGLRGGNAIAGVIGHDLNLDHARIETAGDIKKASFVAGAYLSPNVYVSYGIGLFDPVSTLRLRYVVSNRFTLQAETGKASGADILIKSSGTSP